MERITRVEDVLDAAVQALRNGQRAVLATVVACRGSVPRKEGSKLLFCEDGSLVGSVGGGVLEHRVIERCRELIHAWVRVPESLEIDLSPEGSLDARCGGTVTVFLDPLGSLNRLIVVGAGHVGLAVARLARATGGFRILLLDDREAGRNEELFLHPWERQIGQIQGILKELAFGPQDAVVIVTRGHRLDEDALEAVAGRGAGYVGMIGSRAKVQELMERLKARGLSAEALSDVYSPIGLDIGAETPEELALCILAEIMVVLREKTGQHCREVKR